MASRGHRAERMAPDERRAAIVDATVPLVLEHGTRVTVRLIAEAAGIAEGTIFTVFPDKNALMRAVLDKGLDPEPAVRELAGIEAAQPLRQRMLAVIDIVQRRMRRTFLLITALGLTGPPPECADDTRRRRDQVENAITAAIVDVIEPDAAQLSVSPADLAHVLRLLTFASTHPVINHGRPLAPEQIVGLLLDGARSPRTDPTTTRTATRTPQRD